MERRSSRNTDHGMAMPKRQKTEANTARLAEDDEMDRTERPAVKTEPDGENRVGIYATPDAQQEAAVKSENNGQAKDQASIKDEIKEEAKSKPECAIKPELNDSKIPPLGVTSYQNAQPGQTRLATLAEAHAAHYNNYRQAPVLLNAPKFPSFDGAFFMSAPSPEGFVDLRKWCYVLPLQLNHPQPFQDHNLNGHINTLLSMLDGTVPVPEDQGKAAENRRASREYHTFVHPGNRDEQLQQYLEEEDLHQRQRDIDRIQRELIGYESRQNHQSHEGVIVTIRGQTMTVAAVRRWVAGLHHQVRTLLPEIDSILAELGEEVRVEANRREEAQRKNGQKDGSRGQGSG